jgi:hypothetical protein
MIFRNIANTTIMHTLWIETQTTSERKRNEDSLDSNMGRVGLDVMLVVFRQP